MSKGDGMKRLEKWNSILWFIIGIVIVAFLSIAAIDSITSKINQKPLKEHKKGLVVGSELEKAKSDSLALQDIRVSLPQRTYNSDYRFIRLECKDLIKPRHGIAHSSSVNLIEPEYYGIENREAHRALSDVYATFELYKKLNLE